MAVQEKSDYSEVASGIQSIGLHRFPQMLKLRSRKMMEAVPKIKPEPRWLPRSTVGLGVVLGVVREVGKLMATVGLGSAHVCKVTDACRPVRDGE